jgi:hypothetical protein
LGGQYITPKPGSWLKGKVKRGKGKAASGLSPFAFSLFPFALIVMGE